MDAVTPKAKHDTLDTHSHVVRPAEMEWKKTRFAGCEVKGLLFDKETGLVTALMKFAPGAIAARPRARQDRADLCARRQAVSTRKARPRV